MSQTEAISGEGTEPQLAPILPPEIEREIFEITARFPGNAVKLAVVARRTQIWCDPPLPSKPSPGSPLKPQFRLERLIYETVTLSDQQLCNKFLRTLDSRPIQFFAENVKSLCVPADIEPVGAERVLKACQGVTNLALWLPFHDAPLFPLVSSLQPTHLSINLYALFGMPCKPDFKHPFFSKVTHLEFVDWLNWVTYLQIDHLFPNLTHFAVDFDLDVEGSTARLRDILASCRSLVVCVALVSSDESMIVASYQLASIEDRRLVILSESDVIENWEASLRGTDASVWSFAEGIVAAKTSKAS
ncbi:hypothetical protein B0H19DRAFT_1251122 [Mycena capillaripes]|nr:hypothetical protein B0H19DRAFT_1251122 [Mycena capillaripes]